MYFSQDDSRTLVPNRIAKNGWTLNLAKPEGLFGLRGFPVEIPLLIILFAANFFYQ
jgi:uncharacterized membrane protein